MTGFWIYLVSLKKSFMFFYLFICWSIYFVQPVGAFGITLKCKLFDSRNHWMTWENLFLCHFLLTFYWSWWQWWRLKAFFILFVFTFHCFILFFFLFSFLFPPIINCFFWERIKVNCFMGKDQCLRNNATRAVTILTQQVK